MHKKEKDKKPPLINDYEGERWYYLVVATLSPLLRGITSKHNKDLYFFNHLKSFTTGNVRDSYEKIDYSFCKTIVFVIM